MKKKLKDYSKFKLTSDDIMHEARMRCMKEMYAKAQPSANYDDIYNYYKECQAKGIRPEQIYKRHYLSFEEFKYIKEKYIEAYHLKETFKPNCDVIISDMEQGCLKDKYIPEHVDDLGNWHPGHRSSEKVPKLSDQIGEAAAQTVIDFIKERKNYYRFDRDEERFSIDISLTDYPTGNPQEVIDYWKSQGVELEIDPRHYSSDDFFDEDNGYINYDEDELE